MNERIQDLIRLADVHILPDDSEYGHCIIGLERFAELIVKECEELNRQELSFTAYARMLEVYRKHFGVDE